MKKLLIAVLFLSVLPSLASAQALTDQFTQTVSQSSCTNLQHNMSYRSRDAQTGGEVSTLQDFLSSKGYLSSEPTGYFGLMTVEAVKKFQSATGIGSNGTPGYGGAGPLTRSKINAMACGGTTSSGNTNTSSSQAVSSSANLPSGCASTVGFSITTGVRCLVVTAPAINTYSNLPTGCLSATGYSSTTGNKCDGSVLAPTYPSGCTSTSGWSSTTGKACDGSTSTNPMYVAGCTSKTGYSSIDGKACDGSIPAPTYPAGCTSTSGWSSTTGKACDGSTSTNSAYPAGCTSNIGYSSIDGSSCAVQ